MKLTFELKFGTWKHTHSITNFMKRTSFPMWEVGRWRNNSCCFKLFWTTCVHRHWWQTWTWNHNRLSLQKEIWTQFHFNFFLNVNVKFMKIPIQTIKIHIFFKYIGKQNHANVKWKVFKYQAELFLPKDTIFCIISKYLMLQCDRYRIPIDYDFDKVFYLIKTIENDFCIWQDKDSLH